jgi:nicotinamide phosphoribosyltransferase
MGGGLLQKVNRDTMSFATKLNHITYADGEKRDVMKSPKSDLSKTSLPGELDVIKVDDCVPLVFPRGDEKKGKGMVVVYDCGKPVEWEWESFDEVRERLNREWRATGNRKNADVISPELREKMEAIFRERE